MKLYLHIGIEKTGSTSIQDALTRNRETLASMSVLVPRSLVGWGQHAKLYTLAKDSEYTDDFLIYCGLYDPRLREQAVRQWKEDFFDEIRGSTAQACILSSELLQSRLCSAAELRSLREILDCVFSEIQIIVYLRDPLRLAISFISTALRSGFSVDSFPIPGDEIFHAMGLEIKANHERTLRLWNAAFPDADLSVRLFDRDSLQDRCVVTDFFLQCNILSNSLYVPKQRNSSMSMTAAAILSELNKIYPRIDADMSYNRSRDKLLGLIDGQMHDGAPLLPTREVAAAYMNCYLQSNQWVRDHFFPERDSLFPPYLGPFSSTRSICLDPGDAGSIARLIMAVASHD